MKHENIQYTWKGKEKMHKLCENKIKSVLDCLFSCTVKCIVYYIKKLYLKVLNLSLFHESCIIWGHKQTELKWRWKKKRERQGSSQGLSHFPFLIAFWPVRLLKSCVIPGILYLQSRDAVAPNFSV